MSRYAGHALGWYTSVCTYLQLIDINEWCPPTQGGAAPRLDSPAL